MTKQLYAARYYSQNPVEIIHEFTDEKENVWVVVADTEDDYKEYGVYAKSQLIKWEDTNAAKQIESYNKQIEELSNKKKKLIKDIQQKAVKQLLSRIRFNVAFGKMDASGIVALSVAEELEKLIEKEDPDLLK